MDDKKMITILKNALSEEREKADFVTEINGQLTDFQEGVLFGPGTCNSKNRT